MPDTMPFETTEIRDEEITIGRQDSDWSLNIRNTKDMDNWYLTVQVHEPLTNTNGAVLDNAMYFIENGNESPLEEDAVEIASDNNADTEELHQI